MPAMKKNADCVGFEQVFSELVKEIGGPVDFELPEWLNKWKPAISFIRRNVYLTKKIKRRDDGIFCSCCSTPGSSGVCGRDCLCSILRSCCSSGCNCGNSCLNKPFHQRPMKRMKSVQTEKCGMGIVAEEDIKQGEFVIEYVGEVIDDKTCEERLWKMKHRGETNFYLCEINRDMVIDATYKGNKSRYINHSCCPNTEMQKWMSEGETRIGIFATRDIKMGEHLTYDYQYENLHFLELIGVRVSRNTLCRYSSLTSVAGLCNLVQIKIATVVLQIAGRNWGLNQIGQKRLLQMLH